MREELKGLGPENVLERPLDSPLAQNGHGVLERNPEPTSMEPPMWDSGGICHCCTYGTRSMSWQRL